MVFNTRGCEDAKCELGIEVRSRCVRRDHAVTETSTFPLASFAPLTSTWCPGLGATLFTLSGPLAQPSIFQHDHYPPSFQSIRAAAARILFPRLIQLDRHIEIRRYRSSEVRVQCFRFAHASILKAQNLFHVMFSGFVHDRCHSLIPSPGSFCGSMVENSVVETTKLD